MKAGFLESQRLYYKPVSLSHLSQDYVDWLNDPDVYRYMETGSGYTLDRLEAFLKDMEAKEILFWGIHLKSNDQHIGNIKIDPINKKHGLGEYGILIGRKSEWGKGYAKEASATIIDYCFNVVNLRKITLGVVADHTGAKNLYTNLGFIVEGVYRQHGLYDGKYRDVVRMALFNSKHSMQ